MSENPQRDLGLATMFIGIIAMGLGLACFVMAVWQSTHPDPTTGGAWAATGGLLFVPGLIATFVGGMMQL